MSKLVQLNVCPNLSTGKIARSISDFAAVARWDVWLAYSRYRNGALQESTFLKVGSALDTYFHYFGNKLFDREGLFSRCSTRQLIKKIDEIYPEIVHLHNVHDHWLNYQLLFNYLNKSDIKVVWTFHDCWAFTGHCCHFVSAKCDRWKTGCYDCPLRNKLGLDRSRQNYQLKKSLFTANKNLTIVAPSEWMGDFVKESFLKDCRIDVIHNGVDLSIFKPVKSSTPKEKFQVLAVSNVWLSYKGIYDLYRLQDTLSDQYEIVIVGLSELQIKSLPKGITGVQKTQNVQQLVELYSSADVFINPTYADTFPTVNLEALACGTPVITYRTGGSPEAVDENTGIVVEQGDFDGLVSAIEEVRRKGKSHYSTACRQRAEECFDKDKCFAKYINLYNDLLIR